MVDIIEDLDKLLPYFRFIDWDGIYLLECRSHLKRKGNHYPTQSKIVASADSLDELRIWCDMNLPNAKIDDKVEVIRHEAYEFR